MYTATQSSTKKTHFFQSSAFVDALFLISGLNTEPDICVKAQDFTMPCIKQYHKCIKIYLKVYLMHKTSKRPIYVLEIIVHYLHYALIEITIQITNGVNN